MYTPRPQTCWGGSRGWKKGVSPWGSSSLVRGSKGKKALLEILLWGMQNPSARAFLGTRACNCRQRGHAYHTPSVPVPSDSKPRLHGLPRKRRGPLPRLPCERAVPMRAPRQELTRHASRLVVPSMQPNAPWSGNQNILFWVEAKAPAKPVSRLHLV